MEKDQLSSCGGKKNKIYIVGSRYEVRSSNLKVCCSLWSDLLFYLGKRKPRIVREVPNAPYAS